MDMITKTLHRNFFFLNIFWGDFFSFFSIQYSALLHLPPLRFHCADGCWDRSIYGHYRTENAQNVSSNETFRLKILT
jgi:hypothetical protein